MPLKHNTRIEDTYLKPKLLNPDDLVRINFTWIFEVIRNSLVSDWSLHTILPGRPTYPGPSSATGRWRVKRAGDVNTYGDASAPRVY